MKIISVLKNIDAPYLLDLIGKKYSYLFIAILIGLLASYVYLSNNKLYQAKVTYLYDSSPAVHQPLELIDLQSPGIALGRWQSMLKALPSYVANLKGDNPALISVDNFLGSTGWYEESLRPLLTYSKSDIREYSQLTAQGVLEKNNVIGFTITTKAPTKDDALLLNSEIQKRFILLSESHILKEALHTRAPWLWDSNYLKLMYDTTKFNIEKTSTEIQRLRKVGAENPELTKVNSYPVQDPEKYYSYLSWASQLNAKLTQLGALEQRLRELDKVSQYSSLLAKTLFNGNDLNKNVLLRYQDLIKVNKEVKNQTLLEMQKNIDSEIRFFNNTILVPSSVQITTTPIVYPMLFAAFLSFAVAMIALISIDRYRASGYKA
jgi:hypothetical protein